MGGGGNLRTSCLVWTVRLLSTHCMHIHRYHRKLSTFGTSIKTLSCQQVQWTNNSTAPLWPGRINAASKGVKVLLGVDWDLGSGHGALWEEGDTAELICKGVRFGPVLYREGNASWSTPFSFQSLKRTPGMYMPVQTKACLKKKQIKWTQYFHLKISFKGILSCLRRWIHCVCFLH